VPWGLLLGWLALAWIIYGDGIAARLVLSSRQAADYGIAITLGRQAPYLAAPFATVILPTVLDADSRERRRILWLSLVGTAVVLVAATMALTLATDTTVRLLLLHPTYESLEAVKLYSVIGAGAFGSLLFAAVLTGLGSSLMVRYLVIVAVVDTVALAVFAGSPLRLAIVEAASVLTAGVVLAWHASVTITRAG
jgi:hypothetical protein